MKAFVILGALALAACPVFAQVPPSMSASPADHQPMMAPGDKADHTMSKPEALDAISREIGRIDQMQTKLNQMKDRLVQKQTEVQAASDDARIDVSDILPPPPSALKGQMGQRGPDAANCPPKSHKK